MFKPAFTIQAQQRIDILLKEIKDLYQQLKSCEHSPIQSTIIWSLKPKCEQALQLLSRAEDMPEYLIKKKKVMQVLKTTDTLKQKIQAEQSLHPKIGQGGRINNLNVGEYTQQDLEAEIRPSQLGLVGNFQAPGIGVRDKEKDLLYRSSVNILRSIAMQEIQSTQLKYTKEELDQVLKKLEDNLELVQQVQKMIVSQGNNLEKVEQNIGKAYQNVEQANVHLDEAEKQQIKTVNMVRKGVQKTAMGFWGIVSWPFRKIFRFPWRKQKNPQ